MASGQTRTTVRSQARQGHGGPDPAKQVAKWAPDTGRAELMPTTEQQYWTERQYAALKAIGISEEATYGDLLVFFNYAIRTGLDPFSRQIYMIARRSKNAAGEYETRQTIQIGIDGFRVVRDRAARRDHVEVEYEPTIWYDADGGEHSVWLSDDEQPAAALVVLVKITKSGQRLRFPGVARFKSYAAYKEGKLTGQWSTQGDHMIEKCAEAFANRRGFPHDLGGLYIEDEMQQVPEGYDPAQVAARKTVRGSVDHGGRGKRGQQAPQQPQYEPGEPTGPDPLDDAGQADHDDDHGAAVNGGGNGQGNGEQQMPAQDLAARDRALRAIASVLTRNGYGGEGNANDRLLLLQIFAAGDDGQPAEFTEPGHISLEQAQRAQQVVGDLVAECKKTDRDPADALAEVITGHYAQATETVTGTDGENAGTPAGSNP